MSVVYAQYVQCVCTDIFVQAYKRTSDECGSHCVSVAISNCMLSQLVADTPVAVSTNYWFAACYDLRRHLNGFLFVRFLFLYFVKEKVLKLMQS
jgi:hypothetical protein